MTIINPDSGGAVPAGPGAAPAAPDRPAGRARWSTQAVRSVHRWTDVLLSFRVTRDPAFRFAPGQYARLGLAGADGAIVWRPFSMVSAPDDPELEFVATLVPDGAFSTLLDAVRPGDAMLLDHSSFGFLTVDRVAAGRHLWMLASGTGLGPFVSMLRDPAVWSAFEALVVVHSVRREADLTYRAEIEALARDGFAGLQAPGPAAFRSAGPVASAAASSAPSAASPGPSASAPASSGASPASSAATPPAATAAPRPAARARLHYLPTVTRQTVPGLLAQRIPQLIESGALEHATDLPLAVEPSRVLVCGNPEMSAELRRLLTSRGFVTPRRGLSGQMAFENYW